MLMIIIRRSWRRIVTWGRGSFGSLIHPRVVRVRGVRLVRLQLESVL